MDIVFLVLISLFCGLGLHFYLYVKKRYSYWEKKGVNGPKPSIFRWGTLFEILGGSTPIVEVELLKKYGKVYGNYVGFQPSVTLADPALIKQVWVKDFNLFVDRRELGVYHELFNCNLFFAEGEEWKKVRSLTTPVFTAAKLRSMHKIMQKCTNRMAAFFDKLIDEGKDVINPKEIITGFTIDIIATTTFATEIETNTASGKTNQLVTNALDLFNLNPFRAICFLGGKRWFNDLVGIHMGFTERAFDYFAKLTKSILKQRRESSGKRGDLVQLLMDAYVYENDLKNATYENLTANTEQEESTEEAPKGSTGQGSNKVKRTLTENELISQLIVFFVAGFETTSSTITNCIFELASNPSVQEHLHQELTTLLAGIDPESEQYYDVVMGQIPYLDAVVKETLRKYPALVRFDRTNKIDGYKLGNLTLDAGVLVECSPFAVHHNPEFYPEPEKFLPDRFMPENKHLLVPYSFLAFGAGPRNCVGMRFALQEIKMFISAILPTFKFVPAEKTPAKMFFKPFKPLLNVEPFPIKIEKRV